MSAVKRTKNASQNVKQTRLNVGMNQTEFWGKIGVTQSGGSRYEKKGTLPAPTAMLFDLVYGKPSAKLQAELGVKVDA